MKIDRGPVGFEPRSSSGSAKTSARGRRVGFERDWRRKSNIRYGLGGVEEIVKY